jgi:small subunit ribosomal protein S17
MERKHELTGKVTSIKNDKTITVLVETYTKDSKYKKRAKYSKKYAVHDAKNEAGIGDTVKIAETRPLSKTKHYRLVEIVEKAVIL